MSMLMLRRAAGVYRKKQFVRVITVLLVAAGTAFLQYRCGHIALPIDVEKSNPKFTPAKAHLRQEELRVIGPSADAVERLLLSGEGKEFEIIDAHFESARLHEEFINLLRSNPQENQFPPSGQVPIHYTAAEDEAAQSGQVKSQPDDNEEPCRTSLDLGWEENSKPPTEMLFFQLAGGGTDQIRNLEMKAMGSDLIVQLRTRNSAGNMQAPGCRKTLSVGDWARSFSSPVLIKIVVPTGSNFRFFFTPFKGKSLRSGPSGLYEPFELEARALNAHAVRVVPVGGAPLNEPVLNVTVEEGGRPLLLKHLMLGPDELQLDFSGEAMVQEKGKYAVTFDFVEFIKRNQLIAVILGMIDLALAGWLWSVLSEWLRGVFKQLFAG